MSASSPVTTSLLSAAKSPYSPAEVDAILLGILGAPREVRQQGWHALITSSAQAELVDALNARLEQLGAERAVGAAPGSPERVKALREAMDAHGVTGFLVPRGDRYQGEYVPACADRLAHATGFTGSAGGAIITRDGGAVFTDGRYAIQIKQQVNSDLLSPLLYSESSLSQWMVEHLGERDVIGFDPWLMTPQTFDALCEKLARTSITLRALETNLVDATWPDRPAEPLAPVFPHPPEFAGMASAEKRAELLCALRKQGATACLLTATEATAWLLNLRGGDVPFTPLALGYSLCIDDGSELGELHLFMDARKLTRAAYMELEAGGVHIHELETILSMLTRLGQRGHQRVHCDKRSAPLKLVQALKAAGAQVITGQDPTALPRARKNSVEREGTRAAHVRDGVAVVKFLHWLDAELAREQPMDEITASDQLEAFRAQGEHFRGLSFPSISGLGPNGAIIHYRATQESRRTFTPHTLYLIDSGAQYSDGTTDITRTLAVGEPTEQMKLHVTLVLKGMIQLTLARFPAGTLGTQLDLLARQALWQHGLNFAHGTGHGVGSYLSVHEGPQSISPRHNDTALEPGMILSNEPGFYKEDAYGIRLENLIMVTPPEPIAGGEVDMLGFETLTLVPFDLRLIRADLLTPRETDWLNAYHGRVRAALSPLLDEAARAWLEQATRSI